MAVTTLSSIDLQSHIEEYLQYKELNNADLENIVALLRQLKEIDPPKGALYFTLVCRKDSRLITFNLRSLFDVSKRFAPQAPAISKKGKPVISIKERTEQALARIKKSGRISLDDLQQILASSERLYFFKELAKTRDVQWFEGGRNIYISGRTSNDRNDEKQVTALQIQFHKPQNSRKEFMMGFVFLENSQTTIIETNSDDLFPVVMAEMKLKLGYEPDPFEVGLIQLYYEIKKAGSLTPLQTVDFDTFKERLAHPDSGEKLVRLMGIMGFPIGKEIPHHVTLVGQVDSTLVRKRLTSIKIIKGRLAQNGLHEFSLELTLGQPDRSRVISVTGVAGWELAMSLVAKDVKGSFGPLERRIARSLIDKQYTKINAHEETVHALDFKNALSHADKLYGMARIINPDLSSGPENIFLSAHISNMKNGKPLIMGVIKISDKPLPLPQNGILFCYTRNPLGNYVLKKTEGTRTATDFFINADSVQNTADVSKDKSEISPRGTGKILNGYLTRQERASIASGVTKTVSKLAMQIRSVGLEKFIDELNNDLQHSGVKPIDYPLTVSVIVSSSLVDGITLTHEITPFTDSNNHLGVAKNDNKIYLKTITGPHAFELAANFIMHQTGLDQIALFESELLGKLWNIPAKQMRQHGINRPSWQSFQAYVQNHENLDRLRLVLKAYLPYMSVVCFYEKEGEVEMSLSDHPPKKAAFMSFSLDPSLKLLRHSGELLWPLAASLLNDVEERTHLENWFFENETSPFDRNRVERPVMDWNEFADFLRKYPHEIFNRLWKLKQSHLKTAQPYPEYLLLSAKKVSGYNGPELAFLKIEPSDGVLPETQSPVLQAIAKFGNTGYELYSSNGPLSDEWKTMTEIPKSKRKEWPAGTINTGLSETLSIDTADQTDEPSSPKAFFTDGVPEANSSRMRHSSPRKIERTVSLALATNKGQGDKTDTLKRGRRFNILRGNRLAVRPQGLRTAGLHGARRLHRF